MTVSPTNTQATAIELHNGNNNLPHSTTITVSFSNAPAGATFTISGGAKLNVDKVGNNVNVSVKSGNGNQGLFSVTVTPSSGCGSAKTIYVNVVN